MFSSRVFLFCLAFIVLVSSARPTRQRRCPVKSNNSVDPSASSPVAVVPPPLTLVKGSLINIPGPTPTVSTPVEPTTTDKPTTTPASPTTRVSSTVPVTTPKPAPTTKDPAPPKPTGSLPGLLGRLFPVGGYSNSWSTSPAASNKLDLADSTFRPQKVMRSVVHTYADAPDGKKAMKAHYPKGSYTFGNYPQGGFSFYAPGPKSLDFTNAKEATFSYSVFFPKGFAFNKGGKLPGLYGGNDEGEATGCSGGRRSTKCFSVRLMWRADGAGEFYTYLPPYDIRGFEANKKVCNVAPFSDCNPTYGASVGRGAFKFATGEWTTISERVRLNDAGQANGQIELFVNGKSVINVSGIILRDASTSNDPKGDGKIRGMQMQTFFGGSQPSFASPKDQDLFFSDFSAAITQRF